MLQSQLLVLAASVISAIIGGLITGSFMIWQAKREFKNRQDLINQEDKKTENAVLQALKVEIETIRNRYNDNIKPELEKLLEPDYSNYFSDIKEYQNDCHYFYNRLLYYRFLISQDYFSIYNGNSAFIGKIKDNELQKEIVSVYTNIKGFLEIIIFFEKEQDKNEIILKRDLEEISNNPNYDINRTSEMMHVYKQISNRIVEQLGFIKLEQDKLMVQIDNLIRLFENEIKQNHIGINEKKLRGDKNIEEKSPWIEKFIGINGEGFKFDSAMKIIENSVILGLVMYIGVINIKIFYIFYYSTNHHELNIVSLISGVVLILLSMILVAFNSLRLSLFFVKRDKTFKKPCWEKENWPLIGTSIVLSLIFIFIIIPIFSYKLQFFNYSFHNEKTSNLNLKNSGKTKRSLQPINSKGEIKAYQNK